jgi:hypothetical protein
MPRPTEITQEELNLAADTLIASGVKPTANKLREVLKKGSYTTLQKMLLAWDDEKQKESEVRIPEVPALAYQLLERLHRDIYLACVNELEVERVSMAATLKEADANTAEMSAEIERLEGELATVAELTGDAEKALSESLDQCKTLEVEKNQQTIDNAMLTERAGQLTQQLEKAENREHELKVLLENSNKKS